MESPRETIITTDGHGVAPDAATLLREAARELLPVVVDLGPDQAKFSSFIACIVDEGSGPEIVLDPIAEALPYGFERPVRITPVGAERWFVIAQGIERTGPRRARFGLAQARAFEAPDPPATSVAVPESDLLVLVVPGGLHGSSANVFPVFRIGADACEIRSNTELTPGQNLECVEIVGDRRLLRRASAQVLEIVPSYLPDGSRSFSCRLSLRDEVVEAERERQRDLVTDPAEVRRVLEFAGILRTEGWFEAPGWGRGRLRFSSVGKAEARYELDVPLATRSASGQSIRVGMHLFAVSYELDVRVLSTEPSQLVTSLPLILRRRRRHRREDRVRVPPEHEVEISFRNPVTGAVQTHAVSEVSFFGVSFECAASTAVLWRGLPLEQAQLTWGNRLVHLGDLLVESYGLIEPSRTLRCTASIAQSRIADDADMICLLATLAHPQVRTHDGSDFAALHRAYLKARLFGPHMDRNLAPIADRIEQVWRTLHVQAGDLVRTFVHGPEHAPDAAATVMRAWEHGWVLQHVVDTSPEMAGAMGKLQHAYLDHLVPRPDGRYLVFFVKTDNRIANSYLERFFAGAGTPDAVTRSVVELWLRPKDGPRLDPPGEGLTLRPCAEEERLIVARAAQRCFGAYGAAALSMAPGELELPDTARRFAAAGLERSRDCWVVAKEDQVVYALLEERATPGINLTWMLNASWILPVHVELDPEGRALDLALATVLDRPAQSATGERFLNLPAGLDPERLSAWGFGREASLYLYVLTRAGLHRYFHYTAGRYGELDALNLRRSRRRAQQHAARRETS